jgi:thiosulfate/3-mercaptopyruvate sulfurtransferase
MPTSPRNANEEFNSGPRLVNARRFDLDKVAETRPEKNPLGLTHMMPTAQVFRDATSESEVRRDARGKRRTRTREDMECCTPWIIPMVCS